MSNSTEDTTMTPTAIIAAAHDMATRTMTDDELKTLGRAATMAYLRCSDDPDPADIRAMAAGILTAMGVGTLIHSTDDEGAYADECERSYPPGTGNC